MALELKGLSKKYGKAIALQNADLTFQNGVTGILGPNGAGKSTMIKLIAGLILPSNGKIEYDHNDIRKIDRAYRSILGYLPQAPGLYPFFTGRETLQYYARLKGEDPKRADELLEKFHLVHAANKKVGSYSGGMYKRLAIAAALINNPKILILDEPTAGLDPKERIRLREIISQIRYECIVIVATHIVSDVEYLADRIVLLNEGKVSAFSSPSTLLERLSGKVWQINLHSSLTAQYMNSYTTVSAEYCSKDSVRLRVISDEKPGQQAISVYPSLEDVYIYYFGGDE